jgi:hypothetical protein
MKDDKKNQFDKRRKDNKMLSQKSEKWQKKLTEDNKKRNRISRFRHINC